MLVPKTENALWPSKPPPPPSCAASCQGYVKEGRRVAPLWEVAILLAEGVDVSLVERDGLPGRCCNLQKFGFKICRYGSVGYRESPKPEALNPPWLQLLFTIR